MRSTEGSGVEECSAVVWHLEGGPSGGIEELFKGLQSSGELLVLLHDGLVLLFEMVDVVGSFRQDRALKLVSTYG